MRISGPTSAYLALALTAAALACSGAGPSGGDPSGGGGQRQRWGLVQEGALWVTDPSAGPLETCTTDLALDGAGAPLVAVADGYTDAARMFRYSHPSFVELGNAATQPDTSMGLIAASVTAAGAPVLIRVDPDTHALRPARWTGSAWQDLGSAIPPLKFGNEWVRAAASPNGPVIAWLEYPDGSVYPGHVARWNGTDWTVLGDERLVFARQLSVAVAPGGNPVIAYVGQSDSLHVERWDPEGVSTWVALPAPPAPPSATKNVSVAVDGAGAVYLAPSYLSSGNLHIAAVYRLAPGGTEWTSLGTPPRNGPGSMVALHGLEGSGVFAGWTSGEPELARWTPAGWETVRTSLNPAWTGEKRPMVEPVSDTDVWFAFHDGVTLHLTRWQLLP